MHSVGVSRRGNGFLAKEKYLILRQYHWWIKIPLTMFTIEMLPLK